MKKLLLSAVLFSGLAFGQFTITPENFKSIDYNSKDYIVLAFPNKSKHELFVAAKKLVNAKFEKTTSKEYTEIENEQITFSSFSSKSQLIMLNFAGSNIYHVHNQYELNFKDGKVMVKPIYQYLTNFESNQVYIGDLYKKKEQRIIKASEFINQETNGFVSELKGYLSNSVNEDW